MSDHDSAREPARRRWRLPRPPQWLRWSVGILLGLVALVVAVLLAVAWIPAVSQQVSRVALSRWDDSIPGQVLHGDMAGSIGGGLVIDDFELRDGDGRPLVRAARVVLDLDMLRLATGRVSLERALLRDVTVWADHDWSALAPTRSRPRPPQPGWGPDLPVELDATIELETGQVLVDDQPRVRVEQLVLRASGVGRRAQAQLELAAVELPQQQLRIDTLALAGRWAAPVATLEALRLHAPLGSIRLLEPSSFDVSTRRGSVALELDGDVEAIAERLEIDTPPGLDQARVRVRGHGGPARIELRSEAELGPGTTLSWRAMLTPAPAAACRRELEIELEGRVAAGLLDPRQGPLAVSLAATLDHAPATMPRDPSLTEPRRACPGLSTVISDPGQLELGAVLRVTDTHTHERLSLDLGGIATSLSPPRGQLGLELRGPALAGRIELAASRARALTGRGAVVVDELHSSLPIVARLIDAPRLHTLRGRLALAGSCGVEPHAPLETLRCPIVVELDEIDGFETQLGHASLDLELAPLREPVRFRADLRLEDLRRDRLVLDAASLGVVGTPTSFSVRGRGRGARERVALAADIRRRAQTTTIELEQLAMESRRGPDPLHVALIEPTRIVVEPARVGFEALALRAAGGRLQLDGQLGRRGQPSDLWLDLAGIELARIDPLIPGPQLRGRVDAQARLTGSFAHPQGWAELNARALSIGEWALGDLELAARFCEPTDSPRRPGARAHGLRRVEPTGLEVDPCPPSPRADLQVWARLRGPAAKRIELAARVPLSLGAGVAVARDRPLAAHLQLDELRLVELGGVMPRTPSWWRQIPVDAAAPPGDPRLIPEGRVDLDVTLGGPIDRPRIELSAIARELVVDHTALGSLWLRAALDDAGLGIELDAKLGLATLELDAKLPLALDLARGAWAWDRGAEHAVSLELRALDLDALERGLGPKLPALAHALDAADLGGLVSASVRAQGHAGAPHLAAELRAHGLTHRGEAVGNAWVGVEHEGTTTDAIVELRGPLARRLDARVVLPLRLALASAP
ncbi:hypothetical protein, partial [Enhygromyxa salina]|uniref:hypothetical protein n=1 Tax=Enhygromyxa salina TaxID=215803 RepID=UPI0011BA7405